MAHARIIERIVQRTLQSIVGHACGFKFLRADFVMRSIIYANQGRFRRVDETANVAAKASNRPVEGSGTAATATRGPCS